MGYPLKKEDRIYSYKDYLTWPDQEKWELIEGVAYQMTPSPSRSHQKISIALATELYNFLKGKKCEIYHAPFDVRLAKAEASEGDIKTVVQPDLVIVCDPSKLDEKGCLGTPNIIIEIISPATASHDYITKLKLYEQSGVPEYWIVHPLDRIVMIYRLTADGTYGKPEIYSQENSVRMGLFEDFSLDLSLIFSGLPEETP
jgi:Uma2 family endonuclease